MIINHEHLPDPLRVLIFEVEGRLCGHGLEHNFMAFGDTIPEVLFNLIQTIDTHCALHDRLRTVPFMNMPKADKMYYDFWERLYVIG